MKNLKTLIEECKQHAFDLNFTRAKEWKEEKEGRVLVGYMPIYFPREIIHAAGMLPVGIMGGGDLKLLAAASIWTGWDGLLGFLFLVAMLGGVLALIIFAAHRLRGRFGVLERIKWIR